MLPAWLSVIRFDVGSQSFPVLSGLSTIVAVLLQVIVNLHVPQQVALFFAGLLTNHTTPHPEAIWIHYLHHWLGYLLIQFCKYFLCKLLCELLVCARRLPLDLNTFAHIVHSILRFSRWLASMWSFKLVDTPEVFQHSLHCQTWLLSKFTTFLM